MFGIGGQEIIIIGLLVLVIFGPSALPRMARDLGRFVTEARRSIDEFKEELTAGADDEDEEDKTEEEDGRKHRGKRHDEEDEHDL
jgi:Tat protein translocase TatB subunit